MDTKEKQVNVRTDNNTSTTGHPASTSLSNNKEHKHRSEINIGQNSNSLLALPAQASFPATLLCFLFCRSADLTQAAPTFVKELLSSFSSVTQKTYVSI